MFRKSLALFSLLLHPLHIFALREFPLLIYHHHINAIHPEAINRQVPSSNVIHQKLDPVLGLPWSDRILGNESLL